MNSPLALISHFYLYMFVLILHDLIHCMCLLSMWLESILCSGNLNAYSTNHLNEYYSQPGRELWLYIYNYIGQGIESYVYSYCSYI